MNEIPADGYVQVGEAVGRLNDSIAAFKSAKETYQAALDSLHVLLAQLSADGDDPAKDPRRVALARHLYWNEPDIPTKDLARSLGFPHHSHMLEAIGPIRSGVPCTQCGADIPRTSRTWKANTLREGGAVCRPCNENQAALCSHRSHVEHMRRTHAERAAVAAPSWQWRVATAIVRAYPPTSTGIEPGSEHDWHTGTWNEYDSALYVERMLPDDTNPAASVAIRGDVARLLVDAAQNSATWDSARACELTATITDEAPTSVLSRLAEKVDATKRDQQQAAMRLYPDDYEMTRDDHESWWSTYDWRALVRPNRWMPPA